MAQHEVTFPITDPQEILKLRAGDEVTVQGHIIGIRDRTQIRIFDQGIEPPMDLSGAFLLHTAPNVRKVAEGKYEKIRDLIAFLPHPWPGVTGDIVFSACLDDVADTYLATYEDGEWKYVSRTDLGIPKGYVAPRDRLNRESEVAAAPAPLPKTATAKK